MGTFDINIDKLNEAVILAGSRTQLASDLGTAPSYITYMINNGTVELDKAQIIKDRYGVDITQGNKLNLKQYANRESPAIQTHSSNTDLADWHKFIDEFIDKYCVIGESNTILRRDLFVYYQLSARHHKCLPVSVNTLTKVLQDYGFNSCTEDVNIPIGNGVRFANSKGRRICKVVHGIKVDLDAIYPVVEKNFSEWIEQECEIITNFEYDTFDNDESQWKYFSKVRESLQKSYEKYYKCQLSWYDFESLLHVMGFTVTLNGSDLKLKDNTKRRKEIANLNLYEKQEQTDNIQLQILNSLNRLIERMDSIESEIKEIRKVAVKYHVSEMDDYKKECQRVGVEIAKSKGKYKGRKPVTVDETVFNEAYDRYMNRQINKAEFAKILKVSRPTLDKLIKEREGEA